MAQLFTSTYLADADLCAGEAGLGNQVSDIILRTSLDKDSAQSKDFALQHGAMVVLDGCSIGSHLYQVDIAIRACKDADVASLIVANPSHEIGLGSQRLANRFQLPLLTISSVDAMALTQQLRGLLWEPDVEHVATVNEFLVKLHAMRLADTDEVLALIQNLGSTNVCLVDRDRACVAGNEISPGDRRLATHNAYNIDRSSGVALHSVPVVLTPGDEIIYWLIGESRGSGSAQRLLRTLLQIGALYLSALLGSARARSINDSRRRIAVLNEILNTGEIVERDLEHQLREIGWSTTGWNTGIHIKLHGADASRIIELHEEVLDRFRDEGITCSLVERNDGWSGWITNQTEPAVERYSGTVQTIAKALDQFVDAHTALVAHAGIGRPYTGLEGLRRSLTEANEAAVIANARSDKKSDVAHIDQLGMQRVLMGWLSSDDFARYAQSIIQPVLDIDANHELMRTLEVYLDSSCSTTNAAHKLLVHRNTVSNRINKISEVLGASFDDPETRLSLQLALRVVRVNR